MLSCYKAFYKLASIIVWCETMTKKKEEAEYPQTLPRRPGREENWRWPSPTPLPTLPVQDAGRILKQILDRLDAIEKRLESIEKTLMNRQRTL